MNEKYSAGALWGFIFGLWKSLSDTLFASWLSDLAIALSLAQPDPNIRQKKPYNPQNFQKPKMLIPITPFKDIEPMEVDPSLSQFKHPTNYQNLAYSDRPHQGNVQKPFANSGRYTGR